jgi:hypothetical protein
MHAKTEEQTFIYAQVQTTYNPKEDSPMLSKLKELGATAYNSPYVAKSVDFLIESKNYYAEHPREGVQMVGTTAFMVWAGASLDDIEAASEVSAYVDANDYVGRHG